MKIALCGPVEGYLNAFYQHLAVSGTDIRWALCVGSFGAWPDRHRIDRGSRHHAGKDFATMYLYDTPMPIPTVFIAGVHEDHRFLKERQSWNNTQLIQNLHWLANGYKTTIGWDDKQIRVTGLGKVYSKSTYEGNLNKKSRRHYTRQEVEKGCSSGPTDILLLHEHIDCPGIRNLIFATRPKIIVTREQPDQKRYDNVQGIPVITLDRREVNILETDALFN
jgi:hypothetical protein